MLEKQHKCPQCGEPADMRRTNPARPFCSRRCKLIDLGDWLDERRAVPGDESRPWQNGASEPGDDPERD